MTLHELMTEDASRLLVVETRTGVPEIVYFGSAFAGGAGGLESLRERSVPNAALDVEAPATMLPEEGQGWPGLPGLTGRADDGSGWSPRATLVDEERVDGRLVVRARDEVAGLLLISEVELDEFGVLRCRATVRNEGPQDWVAERIALTVPVPHRLATVRVPEGRWVHEFHHVDLPLRVGATEIANRRGRTSHDRPPTLFAGTAGFTNQTGEVWGLHLGWSGNAATRAEVLTDGRRILQLGELFQGDEGRIESGAELTTPWLYVATSDAGVDGVSQAFHRHLRARPGHTPPSGSRPIHLNTWEAVYFDHDLDTLKRLADRAAEVGAERYVLDDGWFHGRRHDRAGLGDWWVDATVWPDGLAPLIEHVTGLGLEFGIWVEPEMVNPDSDLHREHPEWAMQVPGHDPITGRNQLVLDLTRPEVFERILGHLDRLLADHDVSYVKWDMNRDLTQAGSGPRAAARAQTLANWALIDELRRRHPTVTIESCSSGGGRADFGVLERTDRVWTSDSNDALERQRIQSGFLRVFPPELMGAHVGPGQSHTSGRRHGLGFRATTAMFASFGIEWNLLDATDREREQLAEIIEIHKRHRELIHTGTVWQPDVDDPAQHALLFVSQDRTEALLSIAQLEIARYSVPSPIRLPGLVPDCRYRVEMQLLGDSKVGLAIAQPEWTRSGLTDMSGAMLEAVGIQPPALDPESAIVVHLSAG